MSQQQVHQTRVRRNRLETPIYHFVHPTGRAVRLVGMVHAGRLSYFHQVKALVEQWRHAGAEVHSEGSGLGDLITNPPPDLTAEEKELLNTQVAADLQMVVMMPEPGWTHQSFGFSEGAEPWPPGWQRRDMPYLDYLRTVGVDVIREQLQQVVNPSEATRKIVGSRHVSALTFRALALNLPRPPKPTDAVQIDRRNEIALDGVDGTDADVVLIWGTAHLPGLTQGLLARGYQPAGEDWVEVGRLPRLWVSLLALLPLVPALYRSARDASRMRKMQRLADDQPTQHREMVDHEPHP
jgi:hypothetical protein